MYTLKIKWARYERSDDGIVGTADEATLFIPADQVRVTAFVPAGERDSQMKHWHQQADGPGYFNYLSAGVNGEDGGRLIEVERPDGRVEWYLASLAWILGPEGGTIERVAP